ncbi:MAG: hypothetical protein IAI50_17380, partial [Candidatus Eremiobacteraeota bacterium]|nr:hypothetical protein [Candidatus Eremiobacteraeota bacterium]
MFEQLPSVLERSHGDGTSRALLVIDPAGGGLSYVNAAASELFDLRDAQLAEKLAVDLLPELENLAPRDFEARVTRDGVERRVVVRLEDLRGGPYARYAAILASIEPIDEAAPAAGNSDTDSETRRVRRLESLWNLIGRGGFVGAQQVKALLREGATGLSLERASLARLDGDELVVEFAYPGED